MAGPTLSNGVQKKRHSKKKKNKSRTESMYQISDMKVSGGANRTTVSSSSDSDSDVQQKRKSRGKAVEEHMGNVIASHTPEPAQKPKKDKKKKAAASPTPSTSSPEAAEDVSMLDASVIEDSTATPAASSTSKSKSNPSPVQEENFTSIYMRKITSELADDLDKVREANDFTNRSLPILIHALKQGESIFSSEERRRIVSAANV